MKKSAFILFLLAATGLLHAQTIENIRPVQDGEKVNVTYRIGGSTESQIFRIYFSVSVAGGERFEPKAVIGDVGDNIRGGKSYYTIVWDVFEDVEELVDPEFYIGIDVIDDGAPEEAPVRRVTEPVQEPEQETRDVVQPKEEPIEEEPFQPSFAVEEKKVEEFRRNGFFGFSGNLGLGIPVGINFGSLNKWGYWVAPIRMAFDMQTTYDPFTGTETNEVDDFHFMVAAGANRHIVSAGGFYRLHGYVGLGGHIIVEDLQADYPETLGFSMIETGVVNVLGPFEFSAGITYSIGYTYAVNFVFGAGFAF